MIILQDTREQNPLPFFFDLTKKIKLAVGDYGAELEGGIRSKYYFERKSIADLFGTLGKGYDRFKREIIRAQKIGAVLIIIIEGSLSDVANGFEYSNISGKSILKTIFTLLIKYKIYPVFCVDREEAVDFINHFYWAEERSLLAEKTLTRKNKGV